MRRDNLDNADGRQRVVIEGVLPEIDCGRFPIKRTVGESVSVLADVFADGHDVVTTVLKYRHSSAQDWLEIPMEALAEDRWKATFAIAEVGEYSYTIEAWIDVFATWRRDLEKKFKADIDVKVELLAGAELLEAAASQASGEHADELRSAASRMRPENPIPVAAKVTIAMSSRMRELMETHGERHFLSRYEKELHVMAEPVLARFSAWYEMFPRSASPVPGRHGTFKDCEALLPKIADMGFDILYFPPIHPVGSSYRKGKNNSLKPQPGEPGSPWAIGASEGGHKSILSELGTLEDFKNLVSKARQQGLEIALDIAFQCSPDHPYVREQPEWFRKRPDGTVQYAENPPKKYQDIYPLNFESENWKALWEELKSVFEFWMEQGVKVFRVDNPHTKSLYFWEWCISELKKKDPGLIFLAEAFTRRRIMYRLAKAGFTQSYNYFPWRNAKQELTEYMTELTKTQIAEYFRPSLWPNTPDIITQYLQYGGRAAFMSRLVLASTLGASYGIYGPAFEFAENQPREPGSEEYLNSEKFEIRQWDWKAQGTLRELIKRVNQIRKENPALHTNESLEFHEVENQNLIAYSKMTPGSENLILCVVNLDPHHTQSGWLLLPLKEWGLDPTDNLQFHDLITDARFLWSGARNYVELNPQFVPAHIFRLRRFVRREQDFDYFL
ncbi:MAG: alpha amylase catalytic region [Verrucomicrobiales bacterium]|nr:alpha amylase catalytic region [Verrucomicrobiales bacterium]